MTEEKVFAYMREHHMLKPGERVVAGVSGGADSVCLLFVLTEWAKRVPLEIAVVHVNHGIRAEAAEDAHYVEQLCREREIPFYLIKEDVHRKATDWKCSEEEAGRRVRYEAFARVAEEVGAHRIAVAHNSNDRSETMLFHLFRGSGLKGLGSIRPVRDNIIRPLLCLERKEIENYLQEQNISYCQDATNSGDDYTRNRIRHHILPYVEEEIAQGCVKHMAQTAQLLSETEDYMEQQTAEAMAMCAAKSGEEIYKISVPALLQYHPVIQKRVLHSLVKALSPGQKDISYVHILDLLALFTGEGNRKVCLPFGITGRREYHVVIIEKVQEVKISVPGSREGNKLWGTDMTTGIKIQLPKREELKAYCHNADLQAIGHKENQQTVSCKEDISCIWRTEIALYEELELKCSIFPREELFPPENDCEDGNISQKIKEVSPNEYTKWLDYDKIKGCVEVRYRRTGDYLTIAGGMENMVHKSIKDYMITQKIPRAQRDKIVLLAEGSHVLWLTGYRISEYYKICKNTKYVLQVQLLSKKLANDEMEENNGRTYQSTINGGRG